MKRVRPLILAAVTITGLFLAAGCLPMWDTWSVWPPDAPRQIARQIDCRTPMLLIPITVENGETPKLGDPVEIRYPFRKLPELTEKQIGLVSVNWGWGYQRWLPAILLIGSDGHIYSINHGGNDLAIRRARLSSQWRDAFLAAVGRDKWRSDDGFWRLPRPGEERLNEYEWNDPEAAKATITAFLEKHPLAVDAEQGEWERLMRPCFTPNVPCESGRHRCADFTEPQVLNLTLRPEKYGDEVIFPDGTSADNLKDIDDNIDRLWKSGKYRVIALDMTGSRSYGKLDDPERSDLTVAPSIRRHARTRRIPLVILYGDDPTAPAYSGIKPGLRQYWQCPDCANEPPTE
jgi:hypothetical protein